MANKPVFGDGVTDVGFTIGTEASNVITVAVQLKAGGADLSESMCVGYYLSTDSAGDTMATDPGTVAAGTDGTVIAEWVDDVCGVVKSETDGDIDIAVTHTGASAYYLNVIMPSGRVVTSGIVQFA